MPHVKYFWDEEEDNVVREYDENNNTLASYSTEPTKYGSVLSQDRSGERRYFQFDGQGNTAELTDASGAVTDTRRYSAFGETTASSGATSTPFGFGGRWGYHSSGTASVFDIRRRNYNSTLTRWLSPDPLSTMVSPRYSPFVFSDNSPVIAIDPSGLIVVVLHDPWTGQLRARPSCDKATDPGYRPRPCQWASFFCRPAPLATCKDILAAALAGTQVKGCLASYKTTCGKVFPIKNINCSTEVEGAAAYQVTFHSIRVSESRTPVENTLFEHRCLDQAICHELVHAMQECPNAGIVTGPPNFGDRGKPETWKGWRRCLPALADEFQAYFCANHCAFFWECFERSVRSACLDGKCTSSDLDQEAITSLFEWAVAKIQKGTMCPDGISPDVYPDVVSAHRGARRP